LIKQKIPDTFHEGNFKACCRKLAGKDPVLKAILKNYGYPPIYKRIQSFETLIHIILEQQVSLASAKAALHKLKERLGTVTAKKLLRLSDSELQNCYFSRQKIIYSRHLAKAIVSGTLVLKTLPAKSDETIRAELTAIKGIGNWTTDVYLMMCLQRADLFPIGDIALVNSVKHELMLPKETPKETILELAENWRPWRSIASFLFWHAYIKRKGIQL
jgi:DNA-3-methyladenine glycosylase II